MTAVADSVKNSRVSSNGMQRADSARNLILESFQVPVEYLPSLDFLKSYGPDWSAEAEICPMN